MPLQAVILIMLKPKRAAFIHFPKYSCKQSEETDNNNVKEADDGGAFKNVTVLPETAKILKGYSPFNVHPPADRT